MPLFDFQCPACQTIFEQTVPFGRKKSPPCPACGSPKTQKLLTPPAVHFKGSGFYRTDSGAKVKRETKVPEKKEAPKKEIKETDNTAKNVP